MILLVAMRILTCSAMRILTCSSSTSSYILILLLYVVDIIATGSSPNMLQSFITVFSNQFAMEGVGELDYFFGIKVIHRCLNIFLYQREHVDDLLHKFHLNTVKQITTPFVA